MTVKDFSDKYFLHDSGIEEINYDDAAKRLVLKIDACHWWAINGRPKEMINGVIRVTFKDVSRFEYDACAADRIFAVELDNEIFDGDVEGCDTLILTMGDYLPPEDVFYQLTICAACVEVEELAELERFIFDY